MKGKDKYMKFWKSNKKLLIFLVCSSIVFWNIWILGELNENEFIKTIGSSFFFEFIFVGITIFWIERIQEKIKDEEEEPKKEVVYNRIAKIFEKFNFLCMEMCRYSDIEIKEIQNIEELYTVRNFDKIFENLDLESIPCFLSSVKGKWGSFIKSIADYIKSEWKMLIPLYHFIEPKLYNQIDNFFEENELLKMMNLIDDIKKVHEKVNDKSYDKLHKYAESFFRKSSLEKSLKEILNIMKIFNEQYKKNWNKEIELKSSDTEVKCVNKEEIERRNL